MRQETTAADFHHCAHLYGDDEELLAGAVPFVRDGLEAGEAVMVAMPRRNARLVRDELDAEADDVTWVEMEEVGRNPARIIPVWREFANANLASERGARGVGEPIWSGRSADELDECDRHESLLNLAFAGHAGWALMCPYNCNELPREVLERAEQNHPFVSRQGRHASSERYLDPSDRPDLLSGALSALAGRPVTLSFPVERGLESVRRVVAGRAEAVGLGPHRVADLVLAVNEVATNAVEHAAGGELSIWSDRGQITCEVAAASSIVDPLVGRTRPDPSAQRGRGLWIVNQLCDLVQVRSDGGRSVVRMRMEVAEPATAEPYAPGVPSSASSG